jgi:transposase InsO family protein
LAVRKRVTDFTYTRTSSGFVYVAFVVGCFSRAIVGWHAATVKDTGMVTTALKMALWRRDPPTVASTTSNTRPSSGSIGSTAGALCLGVHR